MLSDNFGDKTQFVKKRKKKSFSKYRKKFAKSGRYGRGTQLTHDMYEYFMCISKSMYSIKDDNDEMSMLSSNVLQELKGKESEYCCNQIVCKLVENLLPYSDDEEFMSFIERFSENLRPIFSNPYGSHVLQATLVTAFQKYNKIIRSFEDKPCDKLLNYILKVSNFLLNNLDDFIWDVYSNAIGRTVFNVLGGYPCKGEIKMSNVSKEPVPYEFESVLIKYLEKIIAWPQFDDFCTKQINSAFLQSLLVSSCYLAETGGLVDRIIEFCKSNPVDLADEVNEPLARLIEVVFTVANGQRTKSIYKLLFKKKLTELAVSKHGNFGVQKLISSCNCKKTFSKIFAKLSDCIEDVLSARNTGVLLELVKKCRCLEILQGDCITLLSKSLHSKEPNDVVALILSLTPLENFDANSSPITLHGTLILEELLNFKKPISIVNSFLELPLQTLLKVLCDVKGCHVADSFIRSSTIGEKSRTKLFKKLQGNYFELATSKYGSYTLDAIWTVINVQQKTLLADELLENQSDLCADMYGKYFARKIFLSNFRRNKEEWIKIQKTAETTGKLFCDIIKKK